MPEEIEPAPEPQGVHPYAVQEMAAADAITEELNRLIALADEASANLEAHPDDLNLAFRAERAVSEWQEYVRHWRLIGEVTGYHSEPVKIIEFGV